MWYDIAKRGFDVVASAIGLIVLAPVLLLIAGVIKYTSPGPVLYRGVRSGLHGKPFRILKFRTMVTDAEQRGGMLTTKNDPRITPIGRVLRRYKLDELPQLLNVLLGDMSIVGPRPEMPAYTQLYTGDELLILTVRPGITDYASIEFSQLGDIVGDDDPYKVYEEKVRPRKHMMRIQYVRDRSFTVDLAILMKTLQHLYIRGLRKHGSIAV